MSHHLISSFGLAVLLSALMGTSTLHAQNLGATTVPSFAGVTTNAETTIAKGRADVSTITCATTSSVSSSACTTAGSYAASCPSGNCGCVNWNCTERNAFAGNGSATMEIGIDVGSGPANAPPNCYLIFGEFTTASTDAETTDFNGSVCDPVIAKSTTAPLTGGWQLVGWNTTKITDGAGGSLAGTLNMGTGALKLTLKGSTF